VRASRIALHCEIAQSWSLLGLTASPWTQSRLPQKSRHIYQLSRNKGTGDPLSKVITRVNPNALISSTKAQQIPLKL